MNSNIKQQMKENLKSSLKGWKLWHKLVHTNPLENGLVILIPEKNEQLCFCAALYLDQLVIQKRSEKVIFLSCDDRIDKYVKLYANNVYKIIDITESEAKNLLCFYRLYDFDQRFIVASFKEPFARNGEKALELYPEKYNELFAICIYKLKPYNPQIEEKLKRKIEVDKC